MNLNGQETCPPVDSITEPSSIPVGYCQCGCGGRTGIAKGKDTRRGWTKGQPKRFLPHHAPTQSRQPSHSVISDGLPCMTIPPTRGYEAIVCVWRYEKCSRFKWQAHVEYKKDGSIKNVYAVRTVRENGVQSLILLHRFLIGVTDPKVIVDHWDRNGLNCCDINLRVVDDSQSACNRGLRLDNKSGFKGVSWRSNVQKWVVRVMVGGVSHFLGLFAPDDAVAAARCYDYWAVKLQGAHACTNVMLGLLPPL